jgi:type IV pilus assembly protein PilP
MKQNKLPLLHQLVIPVIGSVCLSLLAGCSNDDFSDLNKYIADVKLKPKGTIESLPISEPVTPFIFKPEDLRDPFKSTKPPPGSCPGPDCPVPLSPNDNRIKPPVHRKEELEAFPIETLKMIGTVNMKSKLWALVKSADKTVYRVQVGNYMGQNYGKIIRISPDKIELMEIVPDQPGTWREQQMSITLADELGG